MTENSKQPHGSPAEAAAERKGLLLYILHVVVSAALAVFGKLAAQDGIPFFQLVLARGLVLVACTAPTLARGSLRAHKNRLMLLLFLRGAFGFLSITTWYWALGLLPVSDVNALSFLAPVFVALLAPYCLGEPTSPGILVAIPFAMVGVLLVAQPALLFGAASQTSATGVALATAHALITTGSKLAVRALAVAQVPVNAIIFSVGAVSLLGSAIICAALPGTLVLPSQASTWTYLAATCGLGYIVQASLSAGLKTAKAAPAAVCDYFSMVLTLLADWLVFQVMPDGLSLGGAAVILVASLLPLLPCAGRLRGGGAGKPSEARPQQAAEEEEALVRSESGLGLLGEGVQLATASSKHLGRAISHRRAGGRQGGAGGMEEAEEPLAGAPSGGQYQQHQQQQQQWVELARDHVESATAVAASLFGSALSGGREQSRGSSSRSL